MIVEFMDMDYIEESALSAFDQCIVEALEFLSKSGQGL